MPSQDEETRKRTIDSAERDVKRLLEMLKIRGMTMSIAGDLIDGLTQQVDLQPSQDTPMRVNIECGDLTVLLISARIGWKLTLAGHQEFLHEIPNT